MVYRSGKHLEVSTLMVTDLSDDERTAEKMADFVLERLGPEVPTHFVRFHPDYKMTNTIRTPIDRLERARRVAIDRGVHHVYLGNVYDTDAANTYCRNCGILQVSRYGLNAAKVGVAADGNCTNCGTDANIKQVVGPQPRRSLPELPDGDLSTAHFDWHGDVRALHVQVRNNTQAPGRIYHRRVRQSTASSPWSFIDLEPGESYRFITAKSTLDETGVSVAVPAGCTSSLHQVFDRAHFPTTAAAEGTLNDDISPLPLYQPQRRKA
jgi:pyruvate formate lyase activating enzyme